MVDKLVITILIGIAVLVPSFTSHEFTVQGPVEIPVFFPVTAYSEIDSCHYAGCPMASGKKAYFGAIACPRYLKLGTTVVINGEAHVCEDRYNKNLSDRFDMFVGYGQEAHTKALKWGVQIAEVEFSTD